MANRYEKALFAGGCFWCMVKPFDQWNGVISVLSGFSGGHVEHPTYKQVKAGDTGHYETVEITYDPTIISYDEIITIFWKQVDPTDEGGQFHDRGDMYRTAIFYTTEEQRDIAEQSKLGLEQSGRFSQPIVTKILPAKPFYNAEQYHQDFYKKSEAEYEADRAKSGRDEFIQATWNDA